MMKSGIKAMMPEILRRWLGRRHKRPPIPDTQAGFERRLRPSDVFLVGHPKSGNTWLAYMLAVLAQNDFEGRVTLANVGKFIPTIHARDRAIAKYEYLQSPRIIRNEGPVYPDSYPKTIYLVRDPRSVLLSYYHHCVHDTGVNDWPLSSFVDEMLAHGCISKLEPWLIRWDRQVSAWIERAKTQSVIIVRYEDLISDRKSALEVVADFAGIDYAEDILTMAVQRGDFSSMRREEETYGAESYACEKGKKGFFVRKGKTDSWKNEMSPELVARIDATFAETMTLTGYTN